MEGLWPLIIMWVLAMLIGGRKKRPPAGTSAPGAEGPAGQQGLSGDLLSALQQLRQAEEEAQRRRAGLLSPPAGSLPPAPPVPPQRQSEARARAYLEGRKGKGGTTITRGQRLDVFTPGPVRPDRAIRRPVRPLEDDDADKSSELEPAVESLEEGRDYDEEAERIIEERRKVAERHAVSSEDLSEAQLARRGQRTDVALGGVAEHREWHERVATGAQPPARKAEAKPRGTLARFADGSARSAVILSEIFGRPRGERA